MMIKSVAVAVFMALSPFAVNAERGVSALQKEQQNESVANLELRRGLKGGKGGKKGDMDDDDDDDDDKGGMWEITVVNLTYMQPMGPFFAMVHSDMAAPLFTLGEKSSMGLALLAENGSPADLITERNPETTKGVVFAGAFLGDMAPPLGPGARRSFRIPISRRARYISLASMLINTNDCFVALNGIKAKEGVYTAVGYDSGSEENNELCSSIPGPGCMKINTDNVRSGNGEGFVHVHRGFHGVGDLPEAVYDWRNPVARIEIKRVYH